MPETTEPVRKFTIPVEIDLGFMGKRLVDEGSHDEPPTWEPLSIEDAIIEAAARGLVAQSQYDLTSEVRSKVREIMEEEIRTAIQPLVMTALERTFQPTDHMGNPKGEPTTLAEMIAASAEKLLRQPTGERIGQRAQTLLDKVIDEHVNKALTKELAVAIGEAKAEVLAAVKDKGAEVLATTIASMART